MKNGEGREFAIGDFDKLKKEFSLASTREGPRTQKRGTDLKPAMDARRKVDSTKRLRSGYGGKRERPCRLRKEK